MNARSLILTSLYLANSTLMASTGAPYYLDTADGIDAYAMSSESAPTSWHRALAPSEQLATRKSGAITPFLLLEQRKLHSELHQLERTFLGHWQLLPKSPQKFQPYLDGLFVMGNSCLEPSPLIAHEPLSAAAQHVKTAASRIGLQYSATFTINYSGITTRPSGDQRNLATFSTMIMGTWFLAKSADDNAGIFLNYEFDWTEGLGHDARTQSVKESIGSLSNPESSNFGGNGPYVANLALGISLFEGQLVMMAGTIDTTNFLDQNLYADDWNGDLHNESFVFNAALPLTSSNLGYLSAWQPCKHFYMLYSTSGYKVEPNQDPFRRIDLKYWVHLTEAGFISEDMLGLGAGIYRFQYAISKSDSEIGSGAGLNIQQQLGKDSSLGFFTRLGWVDEDMASISGSKASVTAGLVLQAPFTSRGWGSMANNDQISFGYLWQKAARSQQPYRNSTEQGFELSAVFQLTPTCFIQPDIQYIMNPIHRTRGADGQVVFQLQTTWRF